MALLLLVAWQVQGTVPPHFHAGMSAADLIAHGEHRHVHLSPPLHAHHHAHARGGHDHDAAGCDFAALPADHDHDAVYLADGSMADVTRTSLAPAPHAVALAADLARDTNRACPSGASAPARYGGGLPALLGSVRLLL